jgi:hypothetical protein
MRLKVVFGTLFIVADDFFYGHIGRSPGSFVIAIVVLLEPLFPAEGVDHISELARQILSDRVYK